MRLTPPTQMMFWISVILVVLAVVAQLGLFTIPFVSANAFWVAVVGYLALFLGNTQTGM